MNWIRESPAQALALLIVLVGLIGIGWQDVTRFRMRRVMAVASVNFRQSIRRRVLWLTPLVILGVVIVSQLQRALDAQDAIRQTTTYCLFATGMLIVLVTIILACTNLPKEIESRVIYTIATKPVTRLEIIIGKVIGFAGVTLCILVIMGVFSWGYLHFQDWRTRSLIKQQLEAGMVDAVSRPTLEYYAQHGTLHARVLGRPVELEVYAHLPQNPADRWAAPGGEGEIYARFMLDRAKQLGPPRPDDPMAGSLQIAMVVQKRKVHVEHRLYPDPVPTTAPTTGPTSAPAATQPVGPRVYVNLYNERREAVVYCGELGHPDGFVVDDTGFIALTVKPELLDRLAAYGASPTRFYVNVIGAPEAEVWEFHLAQVRIGSPETQYVSGNDDVEITYAGRNGQYGQQLRGRPGGNERVAIYYFEGLHVPENKPEKFTFELRSGIESDRTEVDEEDLNTVVTVEFLSEKGLIGPITIYPESQRPTYFEAPAAALADGNFNAVLRVRSRAFLGLRGGANPSLKVVIGNQPFGYNLLKSLGVLWLMSILVIIVSLFCSTFVSWPIAFVLTLVILGGRWMAEQLGDLARPGVGRDIFTQLVGQASAGVSRAATDTLDALIGMLNVISKVLPDISKFSALQDIERGVAIVPSEVLVPSLIVTFGFGIPLMVLSYIFLKYKEVAP